MKAQSLILVSLLSCRSMLADIKATNKTTVAGQSFNSSVQMKNGKIRNETSFAPGFSVVTIQDCSGQKLIQINDRARTYMVTDSGAQGGASAADAKPGSGTVTMNISEQDTGERKQFFGYSARHVKGTITTEGNGSCAGNFHAITDGWYIDLPATQGCVAPEHEIIRSRMQRGQCDDRIVLKTSGVEKLGYPVQLDTTIDSKGTTTTIRQQTTDLSTATLDPALFEVPSGYRQVKSYQELMGFAGMNGGPAARSSQSGPGENFPPLTTAGPNENAPGVVAGATENTTSKRPGVLRIGVIQVTSSTDQQVATDGLQQELANDINFLGGQAVLISADPNDRDDSNEQAKQQGCDYVVFTNIANYKAASPGKRLGSILNHGGLGGVGGAAQARVEMSAQVRVFRPDNPTPVLDGSSDFRGDDATTTAKGLMHTEARSVMLQLKNLQAK